MAITDLMLVKATFKLNRGPSVPQLLFFAHTEEVINSVTGGTAHDGLVRDRNDKVRAAVVDMLEKILVNGVEIDCENVKAMIVGIAGETSVEAEEELIATLTPDWEKRTLAQLMVMAGDEKLSARAFDALHRVAVRKREGLLDLTKGFESGACTALRNFLTIPPRPSDLPEGGRFDGIRPMQREEVCKSEESRWYASIFAESLIRFALNGMIEWTASTGIREQTINMCIAVMMMIDIQQTIPFVEELIIHLYKAIRDDDVDAEKRVTHACRILFGVVVNRLGGECFDKIVNTMAQHVGCVLDAKREVAQDGNFWDEEKLGRVTSRVVGTARTMSHYRVTTREGAQDLLLLLGDGIEVHAGHSIRTDVLSTILDIIHTCLTISVDTISGIPRVLKGMLYLEAESRKEKGTTGLTDALVTRVFSLLLQCLASLESSEVEECISLLALREGTSPAAVYDMYFDVQLSGILSESMHDNWADSDPTRKMLHELLIRSSEESLAKCLNDGKEEEGLGGQLMKMLCYQSNPEQCTPSCRVDVIEIIYDIAKRAAENRGPLLDALKAHGIATITEPHNVAIGCVSVTLDLPIASPPVVTLLRGVILPNLIWRPGQANTRIRKATLVALHALFPAVDSCWMRLIAEELLPLVKSCLDDSFTPDNRHLATTVVIDIFEKMLVDGDQHCDEFDAEVLRECYPDMLKRLDDSVDEIRILSCRALEVLMGILASRPGTMKALSNSVFGYIVRALFVHLDDSNMQLSKAVYATLRKASMAGGSAFEAEVDTAAANSLQPDLCLSLLKKEVST
ncbi:hypothetical protein Pmar_PMAR028674 [Perkinsus marinus ATCC 50983]|uniref:Uncharacterized protein n=1 Tax=Perkinsus marinus (strain ATCC 50983 / TXsc) TaxID=423536 RepID=C5K8K2_PERM5|nr:hypothetical protein Pmar_PMAR028674 [Perkinsus marinus ATCC 50983]EER19209.1 hypothetical protein Pmar_PMAR028674 [Perkinsus marinus ATCC 50983]|eukprot:XP_002787413.1 hypothetical protein Pmar_PMAR028674 [Perkinsus marinus ATCC 50983]